MTISAAGIIDDIIRREGEVYTNNVADRGGPTRWGITQATLSQVLGRPAAEIDVQTLTEEAARGIYQTLYVRPFLLLAEIGDRLLGLLVDSAVQHGVKRTIGWLQTALGAAPDGIIGPGTLGLWTGADQGVVYRGILIRRIKFYASIIHDTPSQAQFANGWFTRVCEFI